LRLALTILVIVIAMAVVLAVFMSTRPPDTQSPSEWTADTTIAADGNEAKVPTYADAASANDDKPVDEVDEPVDQTVSPHSEFAATVQSQSESVAYTRAEDTTESPATVDAQFAPKPAYRAVPAEIAEISTIGSIDPTDGYKLELQLSGWGASILTGSINPVDHATTRKHEKAYEVLMPFEVLGRGERKQTVLPFAARTVTVNGSVIELQSVRWHRDAPGAYHIKIVDENGQPVLLIMRKYALTKDAGGYDIQVSQTFENLSDGPLQVVWSQNAQCDAPAEPLTFMRELRAVMVAYYDVERDPNRTSIKAHDTYERRVSAVKMVAERGVEKWPYGALPKSHEIIWLASMNRYFALATYRPLKDVIDADGKMIGVPQPLDEQYEPPGVQVLGAAPYKGETDKRVFVYTLTSTPIELAAGQTKTRDLALYAGPRDGELFGDVRAYRSLGLKQLLYYNLGCFCTSQTLADILLGLLKAIKFITFDWSVAIIVLVMFVRILLHPITKKAQVNMMRMQKQMSAIQPELEKIKKKYKDDQKRIQQEQMRLWREHGINPAGGCVSFAPMMLQMPIWVALYAMLYFAIDLRHESAFYGLFQAISGDHWGFLADLSSSDCFIRFFNEPRPINLFWILPVDYSCLNVLPLVWGVIMFFNMKLTTPPATNEQAATQQKIMKVMTLSFPIFLYSAPSGLTLYMLASGLIGILDSYMVRKHIREEEERGAFDLVKNKGKKKPSFFGRIQAAAEERAKALAGNQSQSGGYKKRKSDKSKKPQH
jgi:YidC/Oxa1 family membrane protein insertase